MTFTTLSSLFGTTGLITALLVFAVLLYTVFRTQSPHIVMFRLWRLASGRAEIQDKKIRDFIEDQHALMSFRFVSGLVVHRTVDAYDLIDWTTRQGIDVDQLRRAGAYFDVKTKSVRLDRLPGPWWRASFWLGLGAGLLLMWAAGSLMLLDSALLTFKQTRTSILFDGERARRVVPFSASLRVADCTPAALKSGWAGLAPAEVATLCKAFKDKDTQGFVDRSLAKQQRVLLWLLGSAALLAYAGGTNLSRIAAAKRLSRSIVADASAPPAETHTA